MKKTNTRVRKNGSAPAAAHQSKTQAAQDAYDREAVKEMLSLFGRFTPEELLGAAEDVEAQAAQARRVAALLKNDPEAWHLADEATVPKPKGAAPSGPVKTKAAIETEAAQPQVEPWEPFIFARAQTSDPLHVLVSTLAGGSISDEAALVFLCDALAGINRAELRKAILAAGMEDDQAVDLMEAMHVALLVDNDKAKFPGRLALPGITRRMEITLTKALVSVGRTVYEHRELLLKLVADWSLDSRLEFVDALGIAESVARRNGAEIEYAANDEEAMKVLARRMRADLLLGRVSEPEQRAAA